MSAYLRAARAIADPDGEDIYNFSCPLVDRCGGDRKAYRKLFSPHPELGRSGDYEPNGWWCGEATDENDNCRILALLFMHWISK